MTDASQLQYTPVEEIPGILQILRTTFDSGVTKSLQWRKKQLKRLKDLLDENVDSLVEALQRDFQKPKTETVFMEIMQVRNEIVDALNHIEEWTSPTKAGDNFMFIQDKAYVSRDPLGVVLVMAPWNFPINLLLLPLVAAITAGNCVIMKPSENVPNTTSLITKLAHQYLDTSAIRVVIGGITETTSLLAQRFDYIFFTGSTSVGKIVAKAAANYLTPTTLELGGKSPCIVDSSVDVKLAARRIAWGSFLNSGQICITVDYVLIKKGLLNEFVDEMRKAVDEFYGDQGDVLKTKMMSSIVNMNHFNRLVNLLKKQLDTDKSTRLIFGGRSDPTERRIEPTMLDCGRAREYLNGSRAKGPILQEEVFGPILPIIEMDNIGEAINYINLDERPLVIYLFSNDRKVQDLVAKSTASGGLVINDVIMHIVCPGLPFGGVGSSGMGQYHGKWGFDTFTYPRSTLIRPLTAFDDTLQGIRFPPYTPKKFALMNWLMRKSTFGTKGLKLFGILSVVVLFWWRWRKVG